MKDYISGECYWRDPTDAPPPLGTKMILLNPGGVAVIGTWSDSFVAWAPMPKVPKALKVKMLSKYSAESWLHLKDMA